MLEVGERRIGKAGNSHQRHGILPAKFGYLARQLAAQALPVQFSFTRNHQLRLSEKSVES